MTAHKHQKQVFIVGRDFRSCSDLAAVAAKCDVAVSSCIGRRSYLQLMQEVAWDVLIVDLDAGPAMETIRDARRIWPWQFCIALVTRGAVSQAVGLLKAGATDCLEKPVSPGSLLSTIKRGLDFASASLFGSGVLLTRTELMVLHLILAGNATREIAAHLGRSKRTIDAHRNSIYHKLGVKNCIDMVKWAMSRGLLDCQFGEPRPYPKPSRRTANPGSRRRLPVQGDTIGG